mgnify:CR=1 FL=1
MIFNLYTPKTFEIESYHLAVGTKRPNMVMINHEGAIQKHGNDEDSYFPEIYFGRGFVNVWVTKDDLRR